MHYIFGILVGVVLVYTAFAENYLKEKPEWLSPCDTKDPNYDNCVRTNTEEIFRRIATGLPGFTAIESVDPFKINRINIEERGSGAVNLKIAMRNVLVHGFKNIAVKESRPIRNTNWKLKISLPQLDLEGKYTIDGRVLIIPVLGDGPFKLQLVNLTAAVVTQVKLYENDGHKFYNMTNLKVNYNIDGLKIRMDNLFNGNRQLGEATNSLLNENWADVADALKPSVLKTVEVVMLQIAKAGLDFVPVDYILKDVEDLQGN